MSDIRAAAINFEAVKLALRQSKDGIALTLSVHPSDMPAALWSHPIGARYMVALVRLDDTDQPISPSAAFAAPEAPTPRPAGVRGKPDTRRTTLSQRAFKLCADKGYWKWLNAHAPEGTTPVSDEHYAADVMRGALKVGSRAEFDIAGSRAQRAFLEHEASFNQWAGRLPRSA